jgi:hypothetical protein
VQSKQEESKRDSTFTSVQRTTDLSNMHKELL